MELKEKVITNYSNEIGSTVEGLITIGIVTTESKTLLKYDLYEKTFNPMEFEAVKRLILKDVPNYWRIKEEEVDSIISEKIEEILPIIKPIQLDNYYKYLNAEANVLSDKELKKMLKDLLKTNKKRHSKVKPTFKLNPEAQALALINEDIFLDSSLGYVKYNKKEDSFKKLSTMELLANLQKYFKFEGYEFTPEDLVRNARTYYINILTKTDIAFKYNHNPTYKKELAEFKEDYEVIKAIVDKFE